MTRTTNSLLSGLLAALLLVPAVPARSTPQTHHSGPGNNSAAPARRKVAADLDASIQRAASGVTAADEHYRVILQASDFAPRAAISPKLARLQGRVRQHFASFNLVSAELPLTQIRELEADSEIAYISPDREVSSTGFIEETTGANLVRSMLTGSSQLDGKGIGLAILDSGIFIHCQQNIGTLPL